MNVGKLLFTILFMTISSVSVFSAWTEPEPVFEVNSDFEEWSPFLSFDGLTLYFAQLSADGRNGRIFEATLDESVGFFTNAREVPGDLNSLYGLVMCPWVSPDNLRMYYYTQQTGIGWNLMISKRSTINSPWPAGTEISELNALGQYLTAPKLTEDELMIFFQIPDRPGGDHDIWTASRTDRNLPFENVRNLSEINTTFIEAHPYISPDGLELYFVSNRNGYELTYKATRTSRDLPFSNVEHVSFLDNGDECSTFPFITSDGKTFYFVRYLPSNPSTRDIYVSYYYPDNSYFVDANNGDDSNSGSSPKTPLATIQKAIDAAPEGYTIFVNPGVYSEPIDFKGKVITLQGAAGPEGVPVLETPGDFAMLFISNEGPDTVLKNFIIKNSYMAALLVGTSPTISNVTIVDNIYGIGAIAGANPDISNCIFWNNTNGDLYGCQARYCLTTEAGEGNIYCEPLFANPNNGDYHLKSERGRYWPEHNIWVLDRVSSPCINAGDPMANTLEEPVPNSGIINMGAYGGTAYASMGEMPFPDPDYNRDGIINESDLADLVEKWLEVSGWVEE